MGECPACGSQVAENAVVCDSCGVELVVTPPVEMQLVAAARTITSKPPSVSEEPAVLGKVEPHPDLAPSGVLICLRSGADADRRFEFKGTAVIGRFDPSTGPVDVDLGQLSESATISRVHAQLHPISAATWAVKDMGSSNGTFVKANKDAPFQRVNGEQTIEPGSEIAFGNIRFRFEA